MFSSGLKNSTNTLLISIKFSEFLACLLRTLRIVSVMKWGCFLFRNLFRSFCSMLATYSRFSIALLCNDTIAIFRVLEHMLFIILWPVYLYPPIFCRLPNYILVGIFFPQSKNHKSIYFIVLYSIAAIKTALSTTARHITFDCWIYRSVWDMDYVTKLHVTWKIRTYHIFYPILLQ